MGMDLALIPFEYEDKNTVWGFSQTVLNMEQDTELFEALEQIVGEYVPATFNTLLSREGEFPEPHYGDTQETAYGEPLLYVLAGDIRDVMYSAPVKSDRNYAVFSYIDALPSDTKVALYWR